MDAEEALDDAQVDSPEVLVQEPVEDWVDGRVGDEEPNDGEAESGALGDAHSGPQENADKEDWKHADLREKVG